jgi:putative RNA 2'-phosphotransferase
MTKELSKFMSLVLRHEPDRIGIVLDPAGWTALDVFIAKLRKAGHKIELSDIERVVAENDKKRFTISVDGRRIRAAQGHSVPVDLGLEPSTPPDVLFHGTASASLDSIFATGLNSGSRRQVHLSSDEATALKVGGRHGKPVVLRVDCRKMIEEGYKFYRADNGVWLVDAVPSPFFNF